MDGRINALLFYSLLLTPKWFAGLRCKSATDTQHCPQPIKSRFLQSYNPLTYSFWMAWDGTKGALGPVYMIRIVGIPHLAGISRLARTFFPVCVTWETWAGRDKSYPRILASFITIAKAQRKTYVMIRLRLYTNRVFIFILNSFEVSRVQLEAIRG